MSDILKLPSGREVTRSLRGMLFYLKRGDTTKKRSKKPDPFNVTTTLNELAGPFKGRLERQFYTLQHVRSEKIDKAGDSIRQIGADCRRSSR